MIKATENCWGLDAAHPEFENNYRVAFEPKFVVTS
jgi:hypothetical protein